MAYSATLWTAVNDLIDLVRDFPECKNFQILFKDVSWFYRQFQQFLRATSFKYIFAFLDSLNALWLKIVAFSEKHNKSLFLQNDDNVQSIFDYRILEKVSFQCQIFGQNSPATLVLRRPKDFTKQSRLFLSCPFCAFPRCCLFSCCYCYF